MLTSSTDEIRDLIDQAYRDCQVEIIRSMKNTIYFPMFKTRRAKSQTVASALSQSSSPRSNFTQIGFELKEIA